MWDSVTLILISFSLTKSIKHYTTSQYVHRQSLGEGG